MTWLTGTTPRRRQEEAQQAAAGAHGVLAGSAAAVAAAHSGVLRDAQQRVFRRGAGLQSVCGHLPGANMCSAVGEAMSCDSFHAEEGSFSLTRLILVLVLVMFYGASGTIFPFSSVFVIVS